MNMLERIGGFFSGGPQVQRAKYTINELSRHGSLSKRNQQRLEDANRITRRHFLKLAASGTVIAAISAFGGGILYSRTTREEGSPQRPETELTPDPLRAEAIRSQIRDYEAENYGVINEETMNQLRTYIVDLYKTVFAKDPPQTEIFVFGNDYFREQGLTEEQLQDAPIGEAGIVVAPQTTYEAIPIIIYGGEPDGNDPEINKLSVFRALIMHEFIHAQTDVIVETEQVTIGTETFTSNRRRGFKWISEEQTDIRQEHGHYFDELNTQLLAEYLNDPTGQDQIWRRMNSSPLYVDSLKVVYVIGADLLRKMYAKLGISLEQLEDFHFKAQPKEIFEMIDRRVKELGITLPEPASATLFKIKPENPQDIQGLFPLRELVSKITGESL